MGFILNETYCSEENIFQFFLRYGQNYFLCIFNELIINFSTCFRAIAVESICLYSLLSWFISSFNKRLAVFNWHMCKNYKFHSMDSRRNSCLACLREQIFFPLVYEYILQESLIHLLLNISHDNSIEPQISNKFSNPTRMTHENDLQVWPTRMTNGFDPRVWPTRMTHEFDLL